MREKPTLSQLRTVYGFDLYRFAQAAKLDVAIVYQAMLRKPISSDDASKILNGLTSLTGMTWEKEMIDLVLWDDQLLLWVVRASAKSGMSVEDEYTLVYGRDQAHARELTASWAQQLIQTHTMIAFTPCKHGFRIGTMRIPGYCHREGALMVNEVDP